MIVSTQSAQAGATLIEWNLASRGTPSGMWDVHTRIGGFSGSNLQVVQCPTTPAVHDTASSYRPKLRRCLHVDAYHQVRHQSVLGERIAVGLQPQLNRQI